MPTASHGRIVDDVGVGENPIGPNRIADREYNPLVERTAGLLAALGGEAGCRSLSAEFYARVKRDSILSPLFPGKSIKCAIEEFAAFLIQFLGGDEQQTQRRWWVSLRESHARFRIGPAERQAWLKHMEATLDAIPLDKLTRKALRQFFEHSSAYVIREETAPPEHAELAERWREQLMLEDAIAAIAHGRDHEATAIARRFVSKPSSLVPLLARMVQSSHADLIGFVVDAIAQQPSLAIRRFGGRTLLHYAAGAGCLEIVSLLLRLGMDPDVQDGGGHTPLYRVANECRSEVGPAIVRALVRAGADVNASAGVTRSTPLHMAARRGYVEIAQTLLDCGAAIDARDSNSTTPLQRAMNCRRHAIVKLLMERGVHASGASIR